MTPCAFQLMILLSLTVVGLAAFLILRPAPRKEAGCKCGA